MKCNGFICHNDAEVKVVVGKDKYNNNVYDYFCKSCVEGFWTCECCNVPLQPARILNREINIDGRFLCFDCQKGIGIHLCKSCNRMIAKEDEYCISCARDKYIHNYSFKPTPNFFTAKTLVEKLFAGIELEMNFDNRKEFKDFIAEYSHNQFVYLKSDGSISNIGVEIVSHPANFEFHFKNEYWKDIFNMFKHTNTLGCGLHVHLSKDAFTSREVKFLDYFINKCTYTTTQIGSRGLTDYCRKHNGRRFGYDRMSSHTDACNLSNDKTIELRFCKSTDNYKSFIKKLKNIYTLILFVKVICNKHDNLVNVLMKEENLKMLERYFEHFKGEFLSRI